MQPECPQLGRRPEQHRYRSCVQVAGRNLSAIHEKPRSFGPSSRIHVGQQVRKASVVLRGVLEQEAVQRHGGRRIQQLIATASVVDCLLLRRIYRHGQVRVEGLGS